MWLFEKRAEASTNFGSRIPRSGIWGGLANAIDGGREFYGRLIGIHSRLKALVVSKADGAMR